jgi:hypothetical protein
MTRVLNLIVIVALIAAAAWVYKIKFDSAKQVERVARLQSDIRRERDAVAGLRAEWSKLDNPLRVQALSERYLKMRPTEMKQRDALDQLPERPAPASAPDTDPIASLIENDELTGSVSPADGER